jgi:FkbM family methyltransferase
MKRGVKDFSIRPFAADDALNFTSIVERNEYRLPDDMKDWTVIDVGAHIGCFALAAYLRGAKMIFSYEAEQGNYATLMANAVAMAPHVRPYHGAVWRSDVNHGKLSYVFSEVKRRTGGGNVLMTNTDVVADQKVSLIPFDRIHDAAASLGGRPIDLVKLDCEGSEWPILLTSKRLELVQRIFGEFHEIGGPRMEKVKDHGAHPRQIPHSIRVSDETGGFHEAYTQEVLAEFLSSKEFNVRIEPAKGHEWIGHFWAMRSKDEFKEFDR